MASIRVDSSSFKKGMAQLKAEIDGASAKALMDISNEVLRLSQIEVPHDLGSLQNSGGIEPDGDGFIVGYNKVYAARLHEHPEYRFQNGRKGKYLEDPIKNNLTVFRDFYRERLAEIM